MSLDPTRVGINKWEQYYSEEGALSIVAEIEYVNFENDSYENIGSVSMCLFDKLWDDDIVDAADSTTGDNYTIVSEVVKIEDKELIDPFFRIGVLERIFIEKQFRGHGIGRDVVKKVYWYLSDIMRVDIMCLTAKPFERNEGSHVDNVQDDLILKKLIKWYETLGFIRIGKSNHFYLDARLIQPLLDH